MPNLPSNLSEKARRIIYYAEYEAKNMNSLTIEPLHLLLGALRESKISRIKFPGLSRKTVLKALTIDHKPELSEESLSYLRGKGAIVYDTDIVINLAESFEIVDKLNNAISVLNTEEEEN